MQSVISFTGHRGVDHHEKGEQHKCCRGTSRPQPGREAWRPLYVGEFGSYQGADMKSRVQWTQAVVGEARKRKFSWAYWEFCSSFGVHDPIALAWREPLLQSLMGGND